MAAISSIESNSTFAYAPGDLIANKYQLEQLLGEGGMGAVFRARNTSLDMLVAIKLLRADLNRGLLAGKLMDEARAAAKLAHPAIVRVFDVGQTALGDPFIVMELLEGETLSKVIDREQGLTPVHAVQLMLPLADALAAAHAKGLVHRDFKPDNVLLVISDKGIVQPKLLDFGIVKSAQADSVAPSDAGTVVGSPDYMSPEQARGLEQIDARSDLWSFSVVLYEAIAGVTPFQGTDYQSLLRSIVQDEPQSLKERGAAEHSLSYIVSRGLSKDPMARYESLNQMGTALAAWLADQGVAEDASGVSLEAKWLGRPSDISQLGRKSWPPPRAEQISLPPSSLTPLANSSRAPTSTQAASRSKWLFAAAAVLALAAAAIALLGLRSHTAGAPVAASLSASTAQRIEMTEPPALVTIAPTAPSVVPIEQESPPSASATSPQKPPEKKRPTAPSKPRASAGGAPQERLSDKLLAPMTF